MSSKKTINTKNKSNITKKLSRPKINHSENINIYNDDNQNISNDSKSEAEDYSIIKNSLEYYDKYQIEIQKILNNTEYIEIYSDKEINDEYTFYDSDDKVIFKSRIETLSIYIPSTKTWKWSWSVPFAQYKNTLISREILKYAFTLNSDNDLFLKSSLINSKIIIKNDYQLDIYLAISALLSRKPFIFKIYLVPEDLNNAKKKKKKNTYLYQYKKIINSKDVKNYISVYIFAIDWEI